MAHKTGETDWSEKDAGGFDHELKLEDGTTTQVRIFTNPFKAVHHKVKIDEDNKSFGWTIKCAGDDCPLCEQGFPIKPIYWVGVIHRATNQAKILPMNVLIYGKVKELKDDPNWGDPKLYDINITKNLKQKDVSKKYGAVPIPKNMGALSADDIVVSETLDLGLLAKQCESITPEKAQETFDKYRAWVQAQGLNENGKGKKQNQSEKEDEEKAPEDTGDVRPKLKFRTEQRS